MRRVGKSSLFISLIGLTLLTIRSCNSGQSGDEGQLSHSIPDTIFVDHQEDIKRDLTGEDIRLEKDIRYDKYLLNDEYPYKDTIRHFQWEKIRAQIAVQEKKEKMFYTKDGSSEIAGFAPYASRFTNGAYVHGIPTQYPNKSIIESSPTLGTTPRSQKKHIECK